MNKNERIIKKYSKRNFRVYRKSFSCYFDPFYDLIKWKRRIVVIHGLVDSIKYPRYSITQDDFKAIDGYGYYINHQYYFNIIGGISSQDGSSHNGIYCDIEQTEYRSYNFLRFSFNVFTGKFPLGASELAKVLSYIENWLDSNSHEYSYYSPVFKNSYQHRIVITNEDILF